MNHVSSRIKCTTLDAERCHTFEFECKSALWRRSKKAIPGKKGKWLASTVVRKIGHAFIIKPVFINRLSLENSIHKNESKVLHIHEITEFC